MSVLPEPVIVPDRFVVSVLSEDDDNHKACRLFIEQLDRYGWTVHNGHQCLSADGHWAGTLSVYGQNEAWIARHRHDLAAAKALALKAAPRLVVNGRYPDGTSAPCLPQGGA
jgi:hypothetical protein